MVEDNAYFQNIAF